MVPLDQGAAPKLLLANAPDAEQAKIIDDAASRDPALQENIDAFRAELAQIRAQGWAETSGEITRDVYAVAAVVKSRRKVIATISIAGLAYRIPEEDHVKLREMVVNAAQKLSKAYGASTPPM
jgi:DNA-binding IclR family transcriptional regulator